MNNSKKASLLAAFSAMLLPAFAMAGGVYNDVVHDERGSVVVSTNGNCVETKWESNTNQCHGKRGGILSRLSKEQRTVFFDFNKSTLNAKEKAKLDEISKVILDSKEVDNVDIVGYADMIGKPSYNKRLSLRRAQTVKSFLASKGLKTRKIRVEGMGESESVTSCDSNMERNALIACLAADRRVEIELNVKK